MPPDRQQFRDLLDHARQQSVLEWVIAYLCGAALLAISILLLGDRLGWRSTIAPNAAIALAVGFVPALYAVWSRGADYEHEKTSRRLLNFSLLAGALAAALWAFAPRMAPPPLDVLLHGEAQGPARPVVAVLPFRDLSGSDGDAYLASGLQDDLLRRLRGISRLQIASRGAVQSVGVGAGPVEVARALGAAFVARGEVRRLGEEVEVGITLWDGPTGETRWTERFRRPAVELLALQAELAERAAQAMAPQPDPGELARLRRNPTEVPAAYLAFLEGQHHMRSATRDSRDAAIRAFRRAVMFDPRYARAWAGFADAYNFRADLFVPQEVWPVSSALAQRAIELDPSLPEVQATRARILAYYEWDIVEADVLFRRALALGAQCGDESRVCESYVSLLNLMGRSEAAIELAVALVTQRGADPSAQRRQAIALIYARRFGDAVQALEQALQLLGDGPVAARADLMALLAASSAYDGRVNQARQLAREALRLAPLEPIVVANAGIALGAVRDVEGARAALALMDRLYESGVGTPRSYRAAIHAELGETDKAFEALELAYQNREAVLLQILNDPSYDPLRDDPRLARLAARMGVAEFLRPPSSR